MSENKNIGQITIHDGATDPPPNEYNSGVYLFDKTYNSRDICLCRNNAGRVIVNRKCRDISDFYWFYTDDMPAQYMLCPCCGKRCKVVNDEERFKIVCSDNCGYSSDWQDTEYKAICSHNNLAYGGAN